MKNGWVEEECGIKIHYVNDVLHNNDGPAVIRPDGFQSYYQHGKRHRIGGPAVIWPDGVQSYYQHDKRHREDGPAYIDADGYKAYYLFGIKVTKEHLTIMGLDDYPPNGFLKTKLCCSNCFVWDNKDGKRLG